MLELIAHNLAPIMFITVMAMLLIGYPVALTLAAGFADDAHSGHGFQAAHQQAADGGGVFDEENVHGRNRRP